ncbi:MAG: hypothetical protein IKE49_02065 [Firmicutes bacterium]|nr:hypothetical protein [Bacillota bacterium]
MEIIRLKVKNESDLYNPFDADGKMLSEDVRNYIMEKLRLCKLSNGIETRIITDAEIDSDKIEKTLREWSEREETYVKKTYRRNLLQQCIMFAIGVAFIALSLVIQADIPIVVYTVLSTIGAFSIWEACSIWIVKNPELRFKKRMLKVMRDNSTVRIVKEDQEQ